VTRAATRLRADLGTSAVLVTLGNQGLVLVTGEDAAPLVLDAVGSTEAVDVSGAGDTVTALLALGASQDLGAAALLANRGAAVVVMHAGTTSLTAAGLHRAIDQGGPEETEPDLQALLRWWTTTGRAPRG
jgi:bifunctional ADP-heptose synthase (sugar kinase/adenylyltransferase)